MDDKFRFIYVLLLSNKSDLLDSIASSGIKDKMTINEVFSFINEYDVHPNIPWFFRTNGK